MARVLRLRWWQCYDMQFDHIWSMRERAYWRYRWNRLLTGLLRPLAQHGYWSVQEGNWLRYGHLTTPRQEIAGYRTALAQCRQELRVWQAAATSLTSEAQHVIKAAQDLTATIRQGESLSLSEFEKGLGALAYHVVQWEERQRSIITELSEAKAPTIPLGQ